VVSNTSKRKNYLFDTQSIGKEFNMEMCYDGALVMPNNYAVVDEEEMTYVDGGYYMDNATCQEFVFALGLTAFSNVAAISVAIEAVGTAGLATIAGSIPVLGWVVGAIGAYYLVVQAKDFAEALCGALQKGQGVDISMGWYWCVPRAKFTVC